MLAVKRLGPWLTMLAVERLGRWLTMLAVERLGRWLTMLAVKRLGRRWIVDNASVGGLCRLSTTRERRPSDMSSHGQQSIVANEQ
jgi:hypothetical protein